MGAPVRVVLDTNVVLSALVFGGGLAGRLRAAWQSRQVVPLACTDTAQELMHVLAYPKFRLSVSDQAQLLADYLPFAQVIDVCASTPDIPACHDPKDQIFLILAATGQAEVLVTGDKDLLVLAHDFLPRTGCSICTPEAFMSATAKFLN